MDSLASNLQDKMPKCNKSGGKIEYLCKKRRSRGVVVSGNAVAKTPNKYVVKRKRWCERKEYFRNKAPKSVLRERWGLSDQALTPKGGTRGNWTGVRKGRRYPDSSGFDGVWQPGQVGANYRATGQLHPLASSYVMVNWWQAHGPARAWRDASRPPATGPWVR